MFTVVMFTGGHAMRAGNVPSPLFSYVDHADSCSSFLKMSGTSPPATASASLPCIADVVNADPSMCERKYLFLNRSFPVNAFKRS